MLLHWWQDFGTLIFSFVEIEEKPCFTEKKSAEIDCHIHSDTFEFESYRNKWSVAKIMVEQKQMISKIVRLDSIPFEHQ